MRNIYKILIFILIVPFLTELLSYNLNVKNFFNPFVFLFLIIFYGFTALIIRELSIKWNLSLLAVYIVGLGYGLINEGILAETVFMQTGIPMEDMFGQYPLILGLNLPFTIYILNWHALHSVLFPILLINYFFPKKERWLNNYFFWIISTVVFTGSIFIFFNNPKYNHSIYLIIFYIIIFLLIYLSNKFKVKKDSQIENIGIKPVLLGLLFIFMFSVGQGIIAGIKAPFSVSIIYLLILYFFSYKLLKKLNYLEQKPLLLFGLGCYLFHTLINIFFGFSRGIIDMAITGFVLSIVLIGLIYFVKKNKYS
jgi:hypothetical protein